MPGLREVDPEVADILGAENRRQHRKIRLIASENYVSQAVLEATGSIMTNKYSEGYPDGRYYEGQQQVDRLERLCIERARKLDEVRADERLALDERRKVYRRIAAEVRALCNRFPAPGLAYDEESRLV